MVESLFSYRKAQSCIHTLHPICKFSIYIIFSIGVFSQSFSQDNYFLWIKTALIFLLAICFVLLAKTPFSHIKSLRFVLFLGFFVTVFRIIRFEIVEGVLGLGFDFLQINEGLLYTARFFTASLLALVFFETTSPLELQESLEHVQSIVAKLIPPLKKVPLALYVSLSISFIPEIFSAWHIIKRSSRARNPLWRKKKNIIKNVSIFFTEFSALLLIMIERAVQKRKALLNRMQQGSY